MTSVQDQKTATDMYGNERYATGKAEGMQQGMQQGEVDAFIKIYKKGLIKAIEASKMLNMTEKDFLKLVKQFFLTKYI